MEALWSMLAPARRCRILCTLVLLALAPLTSAPAAAAPVDGFDAWLLTLREDALKEGIGAPTLELALSGIAPIPRVIELDRRQASGRSSFRSYRQRLLSDERVRRGRSLMREHRALLERIAEDYGVQARFIVALWGIESTYGTYRGTYPVIPALATLAYDGRRAAFFRQELLNALRILDAGDIDHGSMMGSWAGAMGQSQFMPSSYLSYAVDYDGDGRRDIWTSLPDIFASMANYLANAGWNDRYTWGREVRPPASIGANLLGLEVERPLPSWQDLGIRRTNGNGLPPVEIDASLLWTDDRSGPAYLVYHNFRVLMLWNRSTYFALTVGELSDLIRYG
jgi:membrane-bound lytic murein transglycosylase B